jgi:hypothetical protein
MCHDNTVKVTRKNCDKFITPTVRVSCWAGLKAVKVAEIVTVNKHFLSPGKMELNCHDTQIV